MRNFHAKAARELLTLPEDDPRRIFQGAAIIRRMARLGLVSEEEMKLDMILELSTAKLMDRRLQTVCSSWVLRSRSTTLVC